MQTNEHLVRQALASGAAASLRRPSLRHTVTGFLIHHTMATGWALLHERAFGARKSVQTFPARLGRAAVTAAVANFVDYRLTPQRLQPGFERQLSRTSLVTVYAAFAIGLALVVRPRRAPARPSPPPRE
jgi:hypothetical protein